MERSNVIKLSIKVISAFLVWLFIHSVIFGIAGKDGGVYIMDENYHIGGWPGRMWERYPAGGFLPIRTIENKVEKFAVLNSYIVFKAGDDWFVINRKDRTLLEFNNIDEAKRVMGIEAGKEIHFTSSRPWLRMGFFWPAITISAISGIIAIFFLVKL